MEEEVQRIIRMMRERLDAYAGDRVRTSDVREWLDEIEAAAARPPLRYGVDYGAWGT